MSEFHNVRFPENISYGSSGGPGFNTGIITLDSGHEQRIARWNVARRKYDVGYGVRSRADLHQVIKFFMARNGAVYGFRYKDWTDYTSRSDGYSAPTGQDQLIGTGDGSNTVFQTVKTYYSGGWGKVRQITKPIVAGFIVTFDGVVQNPSVYTVSDVTGEITFGTPPTAGVVIKAGFEFDVPVRFESDTDTALNVSIDNFSTGNVSNINLVEIFDSGGAGEGYQAQNFNYGGSQELTFSGTPTTATGTFTFKNGIIQDDSAFIFKDAGEREWAFVWDRNSTDRTGTTTATGYYRIGIKETADPYVLGSPQEMATAFNAVVNARTTNGVAATATLVFPSGNANVAAKGKIQVAAGTTISDLNGKTLSITDSTLTVWVFTFDSSSTASGATIGTQGLSSVNDIGAKIIASINATSIPITAAAGVGLSGHTTTLTADVAGYAGNKTITSTADATKLVLTGMGDGADAVTTGDTIYLVNAKGNGYGFRFDTSVTTVDGSAHTATGNYIVGLSGVTSAADYAGRLKTVMEVTAVNNNVDITPGTVGTRTSSLATTQTTLPLTQDTTGHHGNSAIGFTTNDNVFSDDGFSGGITPHGWVTSITTAGVKAKHEIGFNTSTALAAGAEITLEDSMGKTVTYIAVDDGGTNGAVVDTKVTFQRGNGQSGVAAQNGAAATALKAAIEHANGHGDLGAANRIAATVHSTQGLTIEQKMHGTVGATTITYNAAYAASSTMTGTSATWGTGTTVGVDPVVTLTQNAAGSLGNVTVTMGPTLSYTGTDAGLVPGAKCGNVVAPQFTGGGSSTHTISLSGGRVVAVTPTATGQAIMLPPLKSVPTGGPIFYLVNKGDYKVTVRHNHSDSGAFVQYLPANTIAEVLTLQHGGTKTWYMFCYDQPQGPGED